MAKLYIFGLLLYFSLLVNARFCVINEDCNENFVCSNGLCACPPAKVPSQDGKNCLDIALGIGAQCKDDIQCLSWITGPSVCTKDGLCGCKPGYRYLNNTCTQVSGFNGFCSSDYLCYDGINSNALKCDGGLCNCNFGADYYLRGDSDCRLSGQHTNVCFFDVDCGSDDKCCEFNYGPEGVCVSNLNPNNTCSLALPNNIFNEKYDDLMSSNTNTSTFNLNIECSKNDECFNVVNNSFCPEFRKKCTCKDGFVYQQSSTSCVPALGSSCDSDNDCLIKYSICNANKICTCRNYFINSNYNDKCFKPARDVGMSCARDENCYSLGTNAICVHNRCECDDNSKLDEKLMLCRVQTDTCNDNKCLDNCRNKLHSSCIDNKCTCDEHYLDKDSKCLPDIGYECSNVDADCLIENAHCLNNKCECLPEYVQEGNRTCKKDNQCIDNCESKLHSFCDNFGHCKCEEHYLEDEDRYRCLPDLGYECSLDNKDCIIANASCVNNICDCNKGFIKIDNRTCVEEKTCDNDCKHKPYSKCDHGKCVCEENYLDQDDNCLPDLGYECNMENNQCKIVNAACINKKCVCNDGYVKQCKRKCKKDETGDKPCTTIIQIYTNNHFTIIN